MGDVLQGAALLCLCKLVGSFVFVPSLSTSHSPVSLCCCCLLIFTDFLVTVFLSFLYVFQSWLPQLAGDVIALRFLLFLSHTYGAVLLLIIPLIAVETLSRLLGTLSAPPVEDTEDDEGSGPTFSYLCCLSVWVIVALNMRWRWKSEEAWSVACLHTTSSLVRCLPKLFSPIPIVVEPFWGVFLFLLLLLLTMNTGLHRRRWGPGQTELTHTTEELVPVEPASSEPGLSVTDVDPGKTHSSCPLLWSSLQMPTRRHGDAPKHERTQGGATVTFLLVEDEEARHRHRWGFSCLGASAVIGLVVVLSVLVLPLNLSVNILVIRTVETLLELWAKCLVSRASDTIEIPALRHEMLV